MFRTDKPLAWLLLLLLPWSISSGSGDTRDAETPRSYKVLKSVSPLTIDGKLDDQAWATAPWTEDFTDIEGPIKPAPLFRTRSKILWDDHYLYIGAELEEPHIWATFTEDETVIFHENDFEVFIDPGNDGLLYYELEINALGTKWDLLLTKPYRQGGIPVNSWDIPGLMKGVYLDGTLNDPSDRDNFWSVELALPWKVLRECAPHKRRPLPGESWRINFSRVQWERTVVDGKYSKKRNSETGRVLPEYNWVWSPQGVIDMHHPETWGIMEFSQ